LDRRKSIAIAFEETLVAEQSAAFCDIIECSESIRSATLRAWSMDVRIQLLFRKSKGNVDVNPTATCRLSDGLRVV